MPCERHMASPFGVMIARHNSRRGRIVAVLGVAHVRRRPIGVGDGARPIERVVAVRRRVGEGVSRGDRAVERVVAVGGGVVQRVAARRDVAGGVVGRRATCDHRRRCERRHCTDARGRRPSTWPLCTNRPADKG